MPNNGGNSTVASFSPPMTPHTFPDRRQSPTFNTPVVTIRKPNLTELEIPAADHQSPKPSASQSNLQSPLPMPPDNFPVMPSSPFIQPSPDVEYATSLVKLREMITNEDGKSDRTELKLTNIREETFNRLLEASSEGHLGQEALRLRFEWREGSGFIQFPTIIHGAVHAALMVPSSLEDPFSLFSGSKVEFSGSPNIYLRGKCLVPDLSICDMSDFKRPTVVFEVAYTQTHQNVSEKAVVYLGGTFEIQLVVNFILKYRQEEHRRQPQHQAISIGIDHYYYYRGMTRVEIEKRSSHQDPSPGALRLRGYQMLRKGTLDDLPHLLDQVVLNVSFRKIISRFERAVEKENEEEKKIKKRGALDDEPLDNDLLATLKKQRLNCGID